MDPRNGPLSRAMRNRAVELFIHPHEQWNGDACDLGSLLFTKLHPPPLGVAVCEALGRPSPTDALLVGALNSTEEKQAMLAEHILTAQLSTDGGDVMAARRPRFGKNMVEVLAQYYRDCWHVAVGGLSRHSELADCSFEALIRGCGLQADGWCPSCPPQCDHKSRHTHRGASCLVLDGLLTGCVDPQARERYQQLAALKAGSAEWEPYSQTLEQLHFARPFTRAEEHRALCQLLSSSAAEESTLAGVDMGPAEIFARDVRTLLHHLSHIVGVSARTPCDDRREAKEGDQLLSTFRSARMR